MFRNASSNGRVLCLRVRGKGKRDRLVPLLEPIVGEIESYLQGTGLRRDVEFNTPSDYLSVL